MITEILIIAFSSWWQRHKHSM